MDLTLLRLLRFKDRHEKLIRAVPLDALDPVTRVILEDFGKFFREFPDVKECDGDGPFWTWFRTFGHPTLKAEQLAIYQAQLRKIVEPVPPEVEAGLMSRLVAADSVLRITALAEDWGEGKEIDVGAALRNIVDDFEASTNRKVKTPEVIVDINAELEDTANDRGFHWRLPQLNLSMRPLSPGDFGIVAGRPDKGKTTFITDNLTHFASQIDEVFPGEDRCILWFNNEGPGNRIVKRLYQSALFASTSDLVGYSRLGTISDKYHAATGGLRKDGKPTIRVFDIHDFWNHEVEDIIKQHNVGLCVFDMLDNVKFGGSASNNGQRTDQLLEAMYQWGRIQAVKHDMAVIAASQISADGENLSYPTLSMLKDSKTGKQGAADWIMTIGALDDFPSSRFLGLTKNKLARESGPKNPKAEVFFDGDRGRYTSMENPTGAIQ